MLGCMLHAGLRCAPPTHWALPPRGGYQSRAAGCLDLRAAPAPARGGRGGEGGGGSAATDSPRQEVARLLLLPTTCYLLPNAAALHCQVRKRSGGGGSGFAAVGTRALGHALQRALGQERDSSALRDAATIEVGGNNGNEAMNMSSGTNEIDPLQNQGSLRRAPQARP